MAASTVVFPTQSVMCFPYWISLLYFVPFPILWSILAWYLIHYFHETIQPTNELISNLDSNAINKAIYKHSHAIIKVLSKYNIRNPNYSIKRKSINYHIKDKITNRNDNASTKINNSIKNGNETDNDNDIENESQTDNGSNITPHENIILKINDTNSKSNNSSNTISNRSSTHNSDTNDHINNNIHFAYHDSNSAQNSNRYSNSNTGTNITDEHSTNNAAGGTTETKEASLEKASKKSDGSVDIATTILGDINHVSTTKANLNINTASITTTIASNINHDREYLPNDLILLIIEYISDDYLLSLEYNLRKKYYYRYKILKYLNLLRLLIRISLIIFDFIYLIYIFGLWAFNDGNNTTGWNQYMAWCIMWTFHPSWKIWSQIQNNTLIYNNNKIINCSQYFYFSLVSNVRINKHHKIENNSKIANNLRDKNKKNKKNKKNRNNNNNNNNNRGLKKKNTIKNHKDQTECIDNTKCMHKMNEDKINHADRVDVILAISNNNDDNDIDIKTDVLNQENEDIVRAEAIVSDLKNEIIVSMNSSDNNNTIDNSDSDDDHDRETQEQQQEMIDEIEFYSSKRNFIQFKHNKKYRKHQKNPKTNDEKNRHLRDYNFDNIDISKLNRSNNTELAPNSINRVNSHSTNNIRRSSSRHSMNSMNSIHSYNNNNTAELTAIENEERIRLARKKRELAVRGYQNIFIIYFLKIIDIIEKLPLIIAFTSMVLPLFTPGIIVFIPIVFIIVFFEIFIQLSEYFSIYFEKNNKYFKSTILKCFAIYLKQWQGITVILLPSIAMAYFYEGTDWAQCFVYAMSGNYCNNNDDINNTFGLKFDSNDLKPFILWLSWLIV